MNRNVRLVVLLGSTREGRFGTTVVRWFAGQAAARSEFEVDVVDVAAKTMLDRLAWWARALRAAREDEPYAA